MNYTFCKTIFILVSLCVVNNTHAMDSKPVSQETVLLKGISSCFNDFIEEVNNIVKTLDNNSTINYKLFSNKLLENRKSISLSNYQQIILDLLFESESDNCNGKDALKRLENVVNYCDEISKIVDYILTINMVNWFNKSNQKCYGLLSQASDGIISLCVSQKDKYDQTRKIKLPINNSKKNNTLYDSEIKRILHNTKQYFANTKQYFASEILDQEYKDECNKVLDAIVKKKSEVKTFNEKRKHSVDTIKKIHNILKQKINDIAYNIDNDNNRKSLNEVIVKFKNSINNYNSVNVSKNVELNSEVEKFFHRVYLDYLSIEYMAYSRDNCAYATISCGFGSSENNNTIMVSSTDYYKKSTDVFKKTYNNYATKIENYEKYTCKYDSNTLIAFDDFNRQYTDSITELCKKYLLVNGRGVVKDDEFQILYYLFRNSDEIVKSLSSTLKDKTKDITTIDVKLFTYMDMCPSCWTAWNECFDALKQLYNNKLSTKAKLNVNVYSIKPYIISKEHPFVENIIMENNNDNNLNIIENNATNKLNINDVNNWCKSESRNKIRQRDVEFKNIDSQNEDYTFSIKPSVKQVADLEGLNMMTQYYINRQKFTGSETYSISNKGK